MKVLYVAGAGRSGTTLVGNVLNEIEGFFHAGELRSLWGLGLQRTRLCGCGLRVNECEVWASVLKRADLESIGVTSRDVLEWQSAEIRTRHTLRLLRSTRIPSSRRPTLNAYVSVMERLYRGIGDVTESNVVVDSSKRPADAAVLGLVADIDPYLLHLVRDPRAVSYSWQRVKVSPGRRRQQHMIRLTPSASSREWLTTNGLTAAIIRRWGPRRSFTMRYEDFVARPRDVIEQILRFLDQPHDHLPFVDNKSLLLTGNHTSGGNPDRFVSGPVRIRGDDEWVTGQPPLQRLVVTAVTSPLLARYGYPYRPTP